MQENTSQESNNVTEFPSQGNEDGEPTRASILAQPDQEFLDHVEGVFCEIDTLEAERKELNEKINAKKAGLEAKGINSHAFKAVKAFRKLSEEQQENYDLSNQVLRKAIKAPVQMDLLDAQIARTH